MTTTNLQSTTTEQGTVTLGTTTYTVSEQVTTWTEGGTDHTAVTTWLTGPRGAQYLLRPFIERKGDTGLRQVISFKSGQPLRVRGNEVRVHHLGNIIEVAK